MFSSLKTKIITLLQLLLVITYIIFEELIWEGIARPVYTYVHSLQILRQIEIKVIRLNPSIILFVFVLLLAGVEAFGLYAGVLFVRGKVIYGAILYLAKIPVAAFTFWLFRVSETKLMQFGWFKWSYDKVILVIDWMKSREIYVVTKQRLHITRLKVKQWLHRIRTKYFVKENPFVTKIRHLYRIIKTALRK